MHVKKFWEEIYSPWRVLLGSGKVDRLGRFVFSGCVSCGKVCVYPCGVRK